MKVGDIVRVRDWSWSLLYLGCGAPEATWNKDGHRRWRVLMTGEMFPVNEESRHLNPLAQNDTMLCDINQPEAILFTFSTFCDIISPAPSKPGVVHLNVPLGTKSVTIHVGDQGS